MNYKLYVMNEEQSRKAQEKAFKMGMVWGTAEQTIQNTAYSFLYLGRYGGKITHQYNDYEYFKKEDATEITFDQWMNMEEPRKPFKAKGTMTSVRSYPQLGYSDVTFKIKCVYGTEYKIYAEYKIKEILPKN